MKKIMIGHVLNKIKEIEDNSVNCIITSPPYYAMRNYGTEPQIWDENYNCNHEWEEIKIRRANLSGGKSKKQATNKGSFGVKYDDRYSYSKKCIKCGSWEGELGQEPTVELYISHLVLIFNECKRILKNDGALWVNLGDTYIDTGKSRKGLYCVPDRFKIGMVENDWICRMENIWHIVNKMPTSVKDRFNTDHEKIFMFVKGQKYKFNQQYVDDKKGGKRIMRTVWSIPNGAKGNSNTASFPEALVKIPILATTDEGDVVLDPFAGTGTTLNVCEELGRDSIGIELKEEFIMVDNLELLGGECDA